MAWRTVGVGEPSGAERRSATAVQLPVMKRRGSTIRIQHKLAGLSFALVGIVIVALTVFFAQRQVAIAENELKNKALLYATLFSKELEPAIAFADRQTTREVFATAADDEEVQGFALFAANGVLLGGSKSIVRPAAPSARALTRTDAAIIAVVPVVSPEGPRGTLVVEISVAPIRAARHRVIGTSLAAGAISLAIGLIASWIIGASFSRRLKRIQSATNTLARGQLDVPPIEDASGDEIGGVARDFNDMAGQIRALVSEIERGAAEEQARLDGLVAARTAELSERNVDLRLVLDNVDQGFLTLDREGHPSKGRSVIVSRWFGDLQDDVSFWEQIEGIAPNQAITGKLLWDSIFDDSLPLEVAVAQMPSRMRIGDQELSLEYRPIPGELIPTKVLVIVSDITTALARARAEASQRDIAAIFGKVVADRSGVEEFVGEAVKLMAQLDAVRRNEACDLAVLRRAIHTLKGNSGLLGLQNVAHACHGLETVIEDAGRIPAAASFDELFAAWASIEEVLAPFVTRPRTTFEVAPAQIERIVDDLRGGADREVVAAALHALQLESIDDRLARIAEQTRSTAARLEKSVTVVVEPGGARTAPERWTSFWGAFIHVVRNAVDHGIEPTPERETAGKASSGVIRLSASQTAAEIRVVIEDDGRGIDWSSLRARAEAKGLALADNELPFASGLSTKDVITEISGRGVGLGAARAACQALGGRVEIESQRGIGTKFAFIIPSVAPSYATVLDHVA